MNGLGSNAVKEYWDQRAKKQGKLTTTLAGSTPDRADSDYAERRAFFAGHVPTNVATLDYGCGVGRYTTMFHGAYVGVDICSALVAIARKEHPDHDYRVLTQPSLAIEPAIRFRLVFTATVLQHNDDQAVRRILESIRHHNPAPSWAIYENVDDQSRTVCGRHPDTYIEMVRAAGFPISDTFTTRHHFHGAEHAMTIIIP